MIVYVNWKTHEVLTEDTYEEEIRDACMDEIVNDTDLFFAWLDENYAASDIYSDEKREEVNEIWEEEVVPDKADIQLADEGWERCEPA